MKLWLGLSLSVALMGALVLHDEWVLRDATDGDSMGIMETESTTTPVVLMDRRGILLEGTTLPGFPLFSQVSAYLTGHGDTTISIDSELQGVVYRALGRVMREAGYREGVGVILDVETGEIHALVSVGDGVEETHGMGATEGLYVPGSIVKPFIALGALDVGSIDPDTEVLSTGALTLEVGGVPAETVVFRDWKAHGYVDMREAIAVSSNVYFYTIGGGYGGVEGLGIERIERYLRMFGIGEKTGVEGIGEATGTIPNPAWKQREFQGDSWRIGDTYLASIGQHGYGVTPLQMTRAVAALAREGVLVTPTVRTHVRDAEVSIPIRREHFALVREGMEDAVKRGTASGLYREDVSLAAKTGTAEADARRERIHSWIVGYYPAEHPRFAFTLLLAYGPWGEEMGAVAAASDVFSWMRRSRREDIANEQAR